MTRKLAGFGLVSFLVAFAVGFVLGIEYADTHGVG